MRTTLIIPGIVVSTLMAGSASAQYKGDVYFPEPSVAVAAGSEVSLEMRMFTGTTALGALHVEFQYDPNALEMVRVEPGTAAEFADAFRFVTLPDRIGIVALNDLSLDKPFGTISIARVTVRPKVVAGKVTSVKLNVRSSLDTSIGRIVSRGFGANIAVVSPAAGAAKGAPAKAMTAPASSVPPQALPVDEAQRIGEHIARPGHIRKVVMPVRREDGSWVAVEVPVNTFDPAAASDGLKNTSGAPDVPR